VKALLSALTAALLKTAVVRECHRGMSSPRSANYEQAVAWLRDANNAGSDQFEDDHFEPADPAKQAAWTAAAQVFALLAIADMINELRADLTAGLGQVQSQLESVTFAIDRLHQG